MQCSCQSNPSLPHPTALPSIACDICSTVAGQPNRRWSTRSFSAITWKKYRCNPGPGSCALGVPSVSLSVPEPSGHRVRSGAVPEVFTGQARKHAGNPVEEFMHRGWWRWVVRVLGDDDVFLDLVRTGLPREGGHKAQSVPGVLGLQEGARTAQSRRDHGEGGIGVERKGGSSGEECLVGSVTVDDNGEKQLGQGAWEQCHSLCVGSSEDTTYRCSSARRRIVNVNTVLENGEWTGGWSAMAKYPCSGDAEKVPLKLPKQEIATESPTPDSKTNPARLEKR